MNMHNQLKRCTPIWQLAMVALLFCLFTAAQLEAQMRFESLIGDTYDNAGRAVVQTADGGYAIAGYKQFTGTMTPDHFTLTRTDDCGNVLWTRSYQPFLTRPVEMRAHDIVQTNDGGFVLVGYVMVGLGVNLDAFIIRTDAAGIMQWYRHFGGDGDEIANSVIMNFKGHFLMTGSTTSYGTGTPAATNVFVAEYLDNGNFFRFRWYGDEYDNVGEDIIELTPQYPDKVGYIILGSTVRNDNGNLHSDAYVLRIHPLSFVAQAELAVGSTSSNEFGYSLDLFQDMNGNDEGVIIAGATDRFGTLDAYLSEVDLNVSVVGSNSTIRDNTADEEARSVRTIGTYEYALAGNTNSWGANTPNIFLAKAQNVSRNTFLTFNWQYTYPFHDRAEQMWNGLEISASNGFAIAGEAANTPGSQMGMDIALLQTDVNGKDGCEESFAIIQETNTDETVIEYDEDYETPPAWEIASRIDYTYTEDLPCPCSAGLLTAIANDDPALHEPGENAAIYPNPARRGQVLYFEGISPTDVPLVLTLSDVMGRQVLMRHFTGSEARVSISTQDLVPGSYYVKLQSPVGVQTVSIVIHP